MDSISFGTFIDYFTQSKLAIFFLIVMAIVIVYGIYEFIQENRSFLLIGSVFIFLVVMFLCYMTINDQVLDEQKQVEIEQITNDATNDNYSIYINGEHVDINNIDLEALLDEYDYSVDTESKKLFITK